jgi:hypothetical protein
LGRPASARRARARCGLPDWQGPWRPLIISRAQASAATDFGKDGIRPSAASHVRAA